MDCNEIMDLINRKDKENLTLELKRKNTLRSRPTDIAEGLVSLANRNGGQMLIGVKDSGELEGKFTSPKEIDEDKGRIDSICIQNCSPPIEYTADLVECPDGDVIVIRVKRRTGNPHAVIKKKGGEIKERTYYIRTSHGKRLVTDSQLGSLFKYSSEPGFSRSFTFQQTYDRKSLSFPHWRDFPMRSITFNPWFSELFRQLSDDELNELKKNEPDSMNQLFIEILPFAALHEITLPFSNHWNILIERLARTISFKPVGELPKQEISLRDVIEKSELVYLPKTSVNIDSFLRLPLKKICVPEDVSIDIDIKSDSNNKQVVFSSLNIQNGNKFGIKIHFGLMGWSVGLPDKHPIWAILSTDDVLNFQKEYAYSTIRTNIEAYVNVFDYNIQNTESLLSWMNNIDSILDKELNWERYVADLPSPILYRIDYNLRKLMGKDYFPYSYLPG